MARPKKSEADRRTCLAQFRQTPAEELTAHMNAAAAGLTPAEYYRRRSQGLVVAPPAARADATLLRELNRIGVNVNQLAFAANADREFKGDWQALRDELARVLDKVWQRYDP
jgi:hypothetical protein